jgi:hypothetical protein
METVLSEAILVIKSPKTRYTSNGDRKTEVIIIKALQICSAVFLPTSTSVLGYNKPYELLLQDKYREDKQSVSFFNISYSEISNKRSQILPDLSAFPDKTGNEHEKHKSKG